MAVTAPISTTTFFYGATNTIKWDAIGGATTYTIQYSKDNGNTWSTCNGGTGIATTGFNWNITNSEIENILGGTAPNSLTNFTNEECFIKIIPNSGTEVISNKFTIAQMPFLNVKPDATVNSISAVRIGMPLNIVWEEQEILDISNVKIEIYEGSTLRHEIAANAPNTGEYTWIITTFTSHSNTANYKIRVTSVDTDKAGAYAESETTFKIVNSDDLITNEGLNDIGHRPPGRMESPNRTASEKAILMDENPTLSQFEAGDFVTILQRNEQGNLPVWNGTSWEYSNNTLDENKLFKAFNLVINVDKTKVSRKKRELEGIITFLPANQITDPRIASEGDLTAGQYYGEVFRKTMSHNWNLGNSSDSEYIAGQTKHSFLFQAVRVDGSDNIVKDQIELKIEPTGYNTIDIYCIIKDTDFNSYNTALSKDSINGLFDTNYRFHYRLTEVMPNEILNV